MVRRSFEHVDCLGCRLCFVVVIGKFAVLSHSDVVDVCFECLLTRRGV